MSIKIKLLKHILKNDFIIDDYKTNNLYTNILKCHLYFKNNQINLISIYKLSFKFKLTLILYSLLFTIDIHLYEIDIESKSLLLTDHLLETILKEQTNIETTTTKPTKLFVKTKIYYKIGQQVYITTWNKIQLFYNKMRYLFNKWVKKYDYITIHNLDKIYFIYLLPSILFSLKICVLPNYNYNNTFYIGDSTDNKTNLFICSKYSHKYPLKCKSTIILFYSITLGQYLLYNVYIDYKLNSIIGKLISIYKIIDKNTLGYKDKKYRLPKTYKIISKHKIQIIKKYKPEELQKTNYYFKLSNLETFYIKYNFNKMIFIKKKYKIDKKNGYLLFEYLLKLFPQLNANQYANEQLSNVYLYNEFEEIENNLFSCYIKNSDTIILCLSYILIKIEPLLIENIDKIINNLEHTLIYDINPIPIIENKNTITLSILNEIKMCFILSFKMLLIFFYNIYNLKKQDQPKNRKQFIYKLDTNNLNNVCIKNGISINKLFKILLLNTLLTFFKNKIVLWNDTLIPLVDNVENIIDICENSTYIQHYLKEIIFYYLKMREIALLYPFTFIQVSEINIENIEKYNLKCDIPCIPIQIHYCIMKDSINITISAVSDEESVKYIIPELYNKLNLN